MLREYAKFSVRAVPMLETNYGYLLHEHTHNLTALIDIAEPAKIQSYVRQAPSLLLSTHHHADHTDGNLELIKQYGLPCLAMDERVPGITKLLKDQEIVQFGSLEIEAIHTPCHTRGSCCFLVKQAGQIVCAFTGDTLFLGGCGYFFEGDAAQMHASLGKLARLPSDCELWVGHEYARDNLRFGAEIEPDNQAIKDKLNSLTDTAIPGTLSNELATNVFMRIKANDPVARMHELRELKNAFNKRPKP